MPIRNDIPYLFDIAKEVESEQRIERRVVAPGLFLGTSASTADGWQSAFYPAGMSQFETVAVDSTFYRTLAAATVKRWYEKAPLREPNAVPWCVSTDGLTSPKNA